MLRTVLLLAGGLMATNVVFGQTMMLSTSNADYQVTNVFSDVDIFQIDVEIDAPLAPGVYNNPTILNVTYRVMGVLEPGTPSGFPAFDLMRDITGTEFYAQGSSLRFEIAQNAVLSDGVQAAELVPDINGNLLTFNGREMNTGRFHPALFELNTNSMGRIQNSNNMPDAMTNVMFGEEYINDLMFDPGNTTLLTDPSPPGPIGGSSSAVSPLSLLVLILLGLGTPRRRSKFSRSPV